MPPDSLLHWHGRGLGSELLRNSFLQASCIEVIIQNLNTQRKLLTEITMQAFLVEVLTRFGLVLH